jgi:hypothetical protein
MRQLSWLRTTLFIGLVISAAITVFGLVGHARAQGTSQKERPFVVEYYYKAKWGHADEFIALFKRNHYPILKKEVESGRLLKVFAVQPIYHTTEDGRWDYRVTIIYKNAAVAHEDDPNRPAVLKQLFPDQETYKKEEQRRFEILDGHWDVPIKDVDLDAK